MLYLAVKFHHICFSRFRALAETRFVTAEQMDRQCDFNMPPDGRMVLIIGAILLCVQKLLQGHKMILRNVASNRISDHMDIATAKIILYYLVIKLADSILLC